MLQVGIEVRCVIKASVMTVSGLPSGARAVLLEHEMAGHEQVRGTAALILAFAVAPPVQAQLQWKKFIAT